MTRHAAALVLILGACASSAPTARQPGIFVGHVPAGAYRVGCCGVQMTSVSADGYFVDAYEARAVDVAPCVRAGVCDELIESFAPADAIVFASYEQAERYCAWRGGRLPTATEWEIAARGADGRRFPWGDTWKPALVPGLTIVREPGATHASRTYFLAGSLPGNRSPFGLYDMAGGGPELLASPTSRRSSRGAPPDGLAATANPALFEASRDNLQGRAPAAFRCVYDRRPREAIIVGRIENSGGGPRPATCSARILARS